MGSSVECMINLLNAFLVLLGDATYLSTPVHSRDLEAYLLSERGFFATKQSLPIRVEVALVLGFAKFAAKVLQRGQRLVCVIP